MSLYDKVKELQKQSRLAKEKDTATTLTTLLGEAETLAKRDGLDKPSDSVVEGVCRKTIKNNKETLSHVKSDEEAEPLLKEIVLLKQFLPSQLSSEQLAEILNKVDVANIGEGMRYLKENYDGQYDGKVAFDTVKSFFEK